MPPNIRKNIEGIKKELSVYHCELVAVSKTKPNEQILEAYQTDHRDFGENKVQELVEKYEHLPKDIHWHMIGHLQRNKVKYIAPFVYLIHGIDSLKLLKEIDKQGRKNNRVISCLLQVHIARESTKFGFDKKEILAILQPDVLHDLDHVSIQGLMGMATNTTNQTVVRSEFAGLKTTFQEIKQSVSHSRVDMTHLSMGMSSDYEIALEEGSTMVRIGSAIFGTRE